VQQEQLEPPGRLAQQVTLGRPERRAQPGRLEQLARPDRLAGLHPVPKTLA